MPAERNGRCQAAVLKKHLQERGSRASMGVKKYIIKVGGLPLKPITSNILKKAYKGTMRPKVVKNKEKIVVLAPHVDDETIGAGGTILQHVNRGAEVHVVLITDGSNSASDLPSHALVEERTKELEKVTHILGIKDVTFLQLEDGNIDPTDKAMKYLRQVIEGFSPDIIYTPTFVDAHPDHTDTSLMLADLLKRYTPLKTTIRLYEINSPIPPKFVNCIIDITDTFKEKKRALNVFKSQAVAFDGFRKLNQYKSNLIEEKSVTYAEVFLELDVDAFLQFAAHIKKQSYTFRNTFKQANRTETLLWAFYWNSPFKCKVYDRALAAKEETQV